MGRAHLRDLAPPIPEALAESSRSSTATGCSMYSRQRITRARRSTLLCRAGARGRNSTDAHRGDVPRRSDQHHRGPRGAAHGAALELRRLAPRSRPRCADRGRSSPPSRLRCAAATARGITGEQVQAGGEHRDRRLGSRAVARVRCAAGTNGAAASLRISCRTSTARSSRI